MPDIKGKLVELIHHCTTCEECFDTDIADRLIANGVTIQKWISVEERLPEVGQRVLVWCESRTTKKHVTVSTYMKDYSDKRGTYFSRRVRNVTHWMPLPEPPKGE